MSNDVIRQQIGSNPFSASGPPEYVPPKSILPLRMGSAPPTIVQPAKIEEMTKVLQGEAAANGLVMANKVIEENFKDVGSGANGTDFFAHPRRFSQRCFVKISA